MANGKTFGARSVLTLCTSAKRAISDVTLAVPARGTAVLPPVGADAEMVRLEGFVLVKKVG